MKTRGVGGEAGGPRMTFTLKICISHTKLNHGNGMRQTTATLQGKREEVIDSSGPSVTLLVAFGPSVRGGGRPADAH